MPMEEELVKIQMEYHENGKFQLHGLTSWPRYPNVFQQFTKDAWNWKCELSNTSQAWLEICHYCVRKNRGIFVAHTSSLHAEWRTMHYLFFPI
jgi:hypothetical protein